MKQNAMVINKETAMRLWSKSFGKSNKAKDFSGREILKAAYDDRGSQYGWNIDHILPLSKGGKTSDSNLVCCHIKTNDEKADKFPCFTSNGKRFEIIKVENHYEIRSQSVNPQPTTNTDKENVNFYDGAAGVRFFKNLKCVQNKRPFVGTVVIELYYVTSIAILDFIRNIFSDKMISYANEQGNDLVIHAVDYNMPQKEDTADLVERCVVLNTYLSHYFVPMGVVSGYNIFYGEHREDDRQASLTAHNGYNFRKNNSLYVNGLIKEYNDEVAQDLNEQMAVGIDYVGYYVYEYNYVKTKLSKTLDNLIK